MLAPAPVHRLHHYATRCKNAKDTRHFYEDILGLPLAHVIKADYVPSTGEYSPYVHLFFRLGDGSFIAFFDLRDGKGGEPPSDMPAWVQHIAFTVESQAALLTMRSRLIEAGVDVLGAVDHGFVQSIYFFDPNGLRLELTVNLATEHELVNFEREARAQLDAWISDREVA